MYHATELIHRWFTQQNIRHQIREEEDRYTSVDVPFRLKNGPQTFIRFISHDDDNDVSLRILNLVNDIPDDMADLFIRQADRMNEQQPYLKVCLDERGRKGHAPHYELDLEYDLSDDTCDSNVGPLCEFLLEESRTALAQIYPHFMQLLWQQNNEVTLRNESSFREFLSMAMQSLARGEKPGKADDDSQPDAQTG